MLLYKYLIPERADVLETQTIRFTPPAEFNDPFEVAFSFTRLKGPGELGVQTLNEFHPRLVENYLTTPRLQLQFPTLDHYLVFSIPFIAQGVDAAETESARMGPELSARFADAYQRIGVLCLSEEPNVPLMWSHYAGNHGGLVVGFDVDHPWFLPPADEPGFNLPQQITYRARRPSGPMAEMDYEDLFLTKHIDWAYEREQRAIRRLDQADHVVDGGCVHLFKFPADALRMVVIGAMASAKTAERVVRAARALGPNVGVQQAKLHGTTYSLELHPV